MLKPWTARNQVLGRRKRASAEIDKQTQSIECVFTFLVLVLCYMTEIEDAPSPFLLMNPSNICLGHIQSYLPLPIKHIVGWSGRRLNILGPLSK